MTASTAPTQPPDKCPVCLEFLVDRASAAFITFVCGQVMYLDEGGDWKPQTSWECVCERSQQVAIALRAERDAALARAEKAEGERDALKTHAYVWAGSNPFTGEQVLQLLNENDAARARLAELQAVGRELSKYRANMMYYEKGYCGGCETCGNPPYPEADSPEFLMIVLTQIEKLCAALASGAESKVTK